MMRALTITTPSEAENVMAREFGVPRAMVFHALTKSELVRRWYAPPPERCRFMLVA